VRSRGEKVLVIVDFQWVEHQIELHGIRIPHHSSRFGLR
jgi:hypothetical protein